jgi:hypothetical protein
MDQSTTVTGYARLAPWQARAVMAAWALLALFCLAMMPSPPPVSDAREEGNGNGDVALYRAEVDRVHAGEGYYQVAAQELVARGYPTRSVFNWRTPLPMWLIGSLPAPLLGKLLLGLLAFGSLVLAFESTSREQSNVFRGPLPLVLLMMGPFLPCLLGDLYVMPVLWAGSLITLSVCAYGVHRPGLGAAAGVAAVFFRELAMPYCLLAAAWAAWRGQRRERLIWIAGLTAWTLFFALHWLQVKQLTRPDAVGHSEGWIQFGGIGFVQATMQMNACLLMLPQWVTALYFVAAMCGLAGWQSRFGLRVGLTVCLFVLIFSVVGHDFNRYWGLLISPLACFGMVRFPASAADLWRAAAISSRSGLLQIGGRASRAVPSPAGRGLG